MTQQEFQEVAPGLPQTPGIYKYYDASGNLLYVGKAKHIRKRVASYFNKTLSSYKTHELVRRIQRLLLPALRHPGDPYAAGTAMPAAPLPGLAPALAYAALLEPRTDPDALQLRAATLRERNRLLDALNAATTAVDDGLATLRALGFG